MCCLHPPVFCCMWSCFCLSGCFFFLCSFWLNTLSNFLFQHCWELASEADTMLKIVNPVDSVQLCWDSSHTSTPPTLFHNPFSVLISDSRSRWFFSVQLTPVCGIRVSMTDIEVYFKTSWWKWSSFFLLDRQRWMKQPHHHHICVLHLHKFITQRNKHFSYEIPSKI